MNLDEKERGICMKKITNLLNEKYDNHIFPFLWMHGEEKETI